MNNEQRQPLPPPTRRRSKRFAPFAILALFLALAAGAMLYGSPLVDMVKSRFYTPDSHVSSITQRIMLSPRGEQIFYATFPAIQDQQQFNASCHSTERTTAILGCYYLDRIYLYNIQNTELDGTLEVTAAHEMLHAAYARLNMFERQRIDQLVEQEYAKIKDQPKMKQIMAYYAKAEPGAEKDELHSIIGTTIGDLPDALEQHYAQYFTDRSSVVALNAKYNEVFSSLSQRADQLSNELKAEEPVIKEQLARYDADLQQVNYDIQSFNQRATNGDFTSQADFSSSRSTLVARVNELNNRRDEINARVDAYNEKVAELNKLAVKANELNQSLNGVAAPEAL